MAGWKGGFKKVGEFWQYRFMLDGMLYTGSSRCANLQDAKSWLSAYKTRLARAEVGLVDAPTVEKAFNVWIATKQNISTKANLDRARCAMERHVLPILGSRKADRVRTEDVARVVQTYLRGTGPYGQSRTEDGANVVIAYLRAIFRFLVEEGHLVRIPFRMKKLRTQAKPRTTLPLDKVVPFLEHLDQNSHIHIRVAVRFMLMLGLRETEALQARREWLHGNSYSLGKTKGKETKTLEIPPDLFELLETLPKDSPWLLPREGDKPHFQQFTRKAIERAGIAVGVPGLTPHRLRATYATLLSQTGASVYEVQKLLRHKQISTTLHYVQTDEQQLKDANQRLWSRTRQGTSSHPQDPVVQDEIPVAKSTRESPSSLSTRDTSIIEFKPIPSTGTWGTTPSGPDRAILTLNVLGSNIPHSVPSVRR